jgi:serine/threonine protein kinase
LVVKQYEVLEEIARGAMSRVHKAKNRETGELLVVKYLPPELAKSPREVEALQNEYEIGKKFNHPNLVVFKEFYSAHQTYFLFMEYCSGKTLRRLTHHRYFSKLTPNDQLELSMGVANGLFYLHCQYDQRKTPILFRDLKPENIILRADGEIKENKVVLIDFGISQIFKKNSLLSAFLQKKKTETVEILGTNTYMSPEQTLGKDLDLRSDIYAFGVVLYEIYTGRPPFLSNAQEKTYRERGSFNYDEGEISAQLMRDYN